MLMENYAGMLNKPPGRWLPVNPGLWAHRTYRPLKVTRSVCPGRAPCLRKGLYLCGARVPSRDTLPRSRSSGRGALPSSAAPTVPCLALPPLPAPRTPSGPSLVCPHPSLQSWDRSIQHKEMDFVGTDEATFVNLQSYAQWKIPIPEKGIYYMIPLL